MERILMSLQYNGAAYQGFQIQHDLKTVQRELERITQRMHQQFVRIHPASRTDKGVHALEQFIHFDSHLTLPEDKWMHAFNSALPNDIVVTRVNKVDDQFHCRYDTIGKMYRYRVYTNPLRDPLKVNLMTHMPYDLNITDMQKAARLFEGTHDFTSFCSAKTEIDRKIRTIYLSKVIETTYGFDFVIVGDGFLYNMVRIIVNFLTDIGQGFREVDDVHKVIEARDRTKAHKTAPSEGLYLERTFYLAEALKDCVVELNTL